MSDVWRAPDGRNYRIWTGGDDSDAYTIQPVTQDPDTGIWHTDGSRPRTNVDGGVFRSTYTRVPVEPLRDPRITRLAELVIALLADYEQATGQPAANVDEIRAALAEVAAIPERERHRGYAAARQAAHSAFHRGRRG